MMVKEGGVIMGNLQETINSFKTIVTYEELSDYTLMFIASNGLYFGTPIDLHNDIEEVQNSEDLPLFAYTQANIVTEEELENEEYSYLKDLNFKETILLENVKFKIGKVITNTMYSVLNVNQIVSLQIVPKDVVDEILSGY